MSKLSHLPLLLVIIFCLIRNAICKEKLIKFDAKPLGQLLEETIELGPTVCTFKYSAYGGTNEEWELKILQQGRTVECVARRGIDLSYLYFTTFSMTLEGAAVKETVLLGNSGKQLAPEEFSVDGNTVTKGAQFHSNLISVSLTGKKPAKKKKKEL